MKEIFVTTKYKKDIHKLKKRGKNKQKLLEVILKLQNGFDLPAKYHNHKLKGDYAGLWECHIEPDWLLVYDFDEESITLYRSGTHSDLF